MIRSRYHYRAFGLNIRSDLEFDELDVSDADEVDVDVRVVAADPALGPDGSGVSQARFGTDRQYIAWRGLGAFTIIDANRIEIAPAPDVDPRHLRLPLLGSIMALLLHCRGELVLHASSVAISGAGAVFLGDKEAGKSTTAAAFIAAGERLISDDVVPVRSTLAGQVIAPGYPQLKLHSHGISRLFNASPDDFALVAPDLDKRRYRPVESFSHDPVPLRTAYILVRANELAIQKATVDQAFAALLRYSYIARLGTAAMSPPAAQRHFQQCGELARTTPVHFLHVPANLGGLSNLVHHVRDHLRSAS